MDTETIRTWAEIDLSALEHNYRALRAMLAPGCRFLGLCKANAYGHGADVIGKKLEELGAEMLAVACVSEAMELRRSGVTAPVLCLGETPEECFPLLLDYQITQMVEDLETGRKLSEAAQAAGKSLTIHVKLDTGMSRLGFFWDEKRGRETADEIAQLCRLPGLEAEGLFTHFADADGSEEYTMEQLTKFLDARQALEERGITFKICHCAASAAVLHYPCTHLDMVRPGIALYGYYPAEDLKGLDGPGLEPVMTVKSRISAVRALPQGTYVSYGRTAQLERDSLLAVVPVGYGDGYPRQLSNRTVMRVHGTECPIVGRVCMDMCMVDVTDVPGVRAGDTVVVYDGPLVERAAQLAGTIPYELLCAVSARVPRVYVHK